MIKSKKIKVLIISILCILTITIGLSYGYYLLNRIQENNNIAGSKCFNLEFTNEKNAISLDNMYPISDEEGRKLTPYSFTITNTCDMLAGYTVNMEMLEGTTLNSKYLDVMVNNEQIKLLTNYESTNTVITGSTESRILAKGTLAYNDSVDYTVRFWMDKDVEDTESMNKIFKSKIVISATPSSWNPKDAGYDTLHDAILANEYQTTPADAISKIEAKGEPDLSQTAPVIKWVEKTGESSEQIVVKPTENSIDSDAATSSLATTESNMKIYTNKTFNSDNATYTLTTPLYVDPTELDFSGNNHYYFREEYIEYDQSTGKLYSVSGHEEHEVYEIVSASKTIETKTYANDKSYESYVYNLKTIKLTETEIETDKSDRGLYKSVDDYGNTYYYRGNVKNNYVLFGGDSWQIVRINGDHSIRLIYYCQDNISNNCSNVIDFSPFNNYNNSPAYVGYMYGQQKNTRDNIVKNEVDSEVKNRLDSWYVDNISNEKLDSYLSDAGFCGDRNLYSGDGFSLDNDNEYSGKNRYDNNVGMFKCINNNDLYTTINAKIGNKSLSYPIGLLSYDELAYAGMNSLSLNRLSWAYSPTNYWLMTPGSFGKIRQNAAVFFQDPNGMPNPWWGVRNTFGVRPVINLKSDVKITGGIGTSNDPYVIDTGK